jgi:hypothetical protein
VILESSRELDVAKDGTRFVCCWDPTVGLFARFSAKITSSAGFSLRLPLKENIGASSCTRVIAGVRSFFCSCMEAFNHGTISNKPLMRRSTEDTVILCLLFNSCHHSRVCFHIYWLSHDEVSDVHHWRYRYASGFHNNHGVRVLASVPLQIVDQLATGKPS